MILSKVTKLFQCYFIVLNANAITNRNHCVMCHFGLKMVKI